MHKPVSKLVVAVALVAFAAAACGPAGQASTSASTPTVDPAADCDRVELSAADLEGGFLSPETEEPMATGDVPTAAAGDPATSARVEAVLAVGEGGPQLTGRQILYAFALTSSDPAVQTDGLIAIHAAVAHTPTTAACDGEISLAASRGFKGGAAVSAFLARLEVDGTGIGCTSLGEGRSFGVECPQVSVRIDGQATLGTLWLRVALSVEPTHVTTLPEWAMELVEPVPTAPVVTDPTAGPVGDGAIRVTWRLEGGIISEGSVVVEPSEGPGPDPGLLILPDVPIDQGASPAFLRLRILGFSGDGAYSGSAVDPAIDILSDSPLLARPPQDMPEPQPWGPILGTCTATVADGGARGTMSCTGDPTLEVDERYGGSVILHATWEPAG